MDPLPILMDAPLLVEEAAAPLSAAPLSVEEAEPEEAMSQPAVVAVGLRPPPGQVHGHIRNRPSSGIVVSHLVNVNVVLPIVVWLPLTHVLWPPCRSVLWPVPSRE